MATLPSWWGQQYQLDNGKNVITTRATTLLQRRKDAWTAKDAFASIIAMQLQQGKQCQHDNEDARTLIVAMTPLLQGRWCQLDDYASLITAEMPLWQGQQLPLQHQQRSLCINSNNTILIRATMPLGWWQGHLLINNDGNAATTMVTPKLEDGNNAIAMRATTLSRIKGNKAIVTRATMSSWQQQGCLHINNSNNTIITRATIAIATTAKRPAHQQQQHHCNKGKNPLQWQQRCLCINDDNKAIATMGLTPAWGWQQCHSNEGTMLSQIKGDNAIVTRAMMLAQWR